jgi:isoleucyl-tRNA synthetase
LNIIKDEVNVKHVSFDEEIRITAENNNAYKLSDNGGIIVSLNTALTDELKEEGLLRDLIRGVQDLRKSRNLVPGDKIILSIKGEKETEDFVNNNAKELQTIANVVHIEVRQSEPHELPLPLIGLIVSIRKAED